MSQRIARVNNEIKRIISQILLKEIEHPPDLLITVTQVKTSPDLSQSKVWISILPQNKAQKFLQKLNKDSNTIRYKLAQKIVLKKTPSLKFFLDLTESRAERIDFLLDNLKNSHLK